MNDNNKIKITFELNGKKQSIRAYPFSRLIDVLREDLFVTGTKEGCSEGECGACSVLVDGEVMNSCLIPAAQIEGTKITTVEGLAKGDVLSTVQEAFRQHGGAQCGFCTPGMLIATTNLLNENKSPSDNLIKEHLSGNLCRCTGYSKIFESVKDAAKKLGDK